MKNNEQTVLKKTIFKCRHALQNVIPNNILSLKHK